MTNASKSMKNSSAKSQQAPVEVYDHTTKQWRPARPDDNIPSSPAGMIIVGGLEGYNPNRKSAKAQPK